MTPKYPHLQFWIILGYFGSEFQLLDLLDPSHPSPDLMEPMTKRHLPWCIKKDLCKIPNFSMGLSWKECSRPATSLQSPDTQISQISSSQTNNNSLAVTSGPLWIVICKPNIYGNPLNHLNSSAFNVSSGRDGVLSFSEAVVIYPKPRFNGNASQLYKINISYIINIKGVIIYYTDNYTPLTMDDGSTSSKWAVLKNSVGHLPFATHLSP